MAANSELSCRYSYFARVMTGVVRCSPPNVSPPAAQLRLSVADAIAMHTVHGDGDLSSSRYVVADATNLAEPRILLRIM